MAIRNEVEGTAEMANGLERDLSAIYAAMEGSEPSLAYSDRHEIASQAVLTVTDDETADAIVGVLEPRIAGKAVIEIGGGIGLLALHMGRVAKRVYCFEANPMWSWTFAGVLLHHKPKNVSYLFGSADEFAGQISGDVAVFCTHSGVDSMRAAGHLFAPTVIDIYGELIASAPDKFDRLASVLRYVA